MENPVDENEDIRQLLQGDKPPKSDQRRTRLALSRARRQVGQQDTMSFALVKIWAVLARLVAPFFAVIAEKQAEAVRAHSAPPTTIEEKNTH